MKEDSSVLALRKIYNTRCKDCQPDTKCCSTPVIIAYKELRNVESKRKKQSQEKKKNE